MPDANLKVYATYDKIASWFDANRSREFFEKKYIDLAIKDLPVGSTILDLGCGMGEPISAYLLTRGFDVTGVDGSSKLLSMAQNRLPSGKFIRCDMMKLKTTGKFQLVIAWHSLFHLTKGNQIDMVAKIANFIEPGGKFLFTTGDCDDEIWSLNGGEKIYHASMTIDAYKELLCNSGFELMTNTIRDDSCGGATVWMASRAI